MPTCKDVPLCFAKCRRVAYDDDDDDDAYLVPRAEIRMAALDLSLSFERNHFMEAFCGCEKRIEICLCI